jgi:hypothetical protein
MRCASFCNPRKKSADQLIYLQLAVELRLGPKAGFVGVGFGEEAGVDGRFGRIVERNKSQFLDGEKSRCSAQLGPSGVPDKKPPEGGSVWVVISKIDVQERWQFIAWPSLG